ncbi:long-chain-fatty-acid--CoA ligase [Nocardia jiangsuensis]|uniref:Long-chain-fatty-acid--CoA ligase n=1 Tax=Nocardia jiangsuensis TaxID=1691563 RepID=A0ABV8DN40_9NOCA
MQTELKYPAESETLSSVIGAHAAERPEAVALISGNREIDYRTLHRAVNRVAHALTAAGVGHGDHIAYLGRDGEQLYELVIGSSIVGAIVVPVNWRLTAAEIAHILTDSNCTMLFVDSAAEEISAAALARAARMHDAVTDIPQVAVVRLDATADAGGNFADWLAEHPYTTPPVRAARGDAVLQMYTSGTTGASKGVMIAQESLFAVWEITYSSGWDWLVPRTDDRAFVAIPGFHIAGHAWVMQGLIAGLTIAIIPEFTPGAALATIRNHRITTMTAVPVMLALILTEPGVVAEDFDRLRQISYGGSPIPESMLMDCMEKFRCEFIQFYGMTETVTPVAFMPPSEHIPGGSRLRSAGRPYPGCEIVVVDDSGNRLPPRQVGEILVRPPAPMLGYWNRPEATAATLVNGRVHTGDAGWLDEQGYLFVSDRINDMIIVGGENVYPAEVENTITSHPAVREAAVVGIPDERWGEAVHAFIVLAPDRTVTGRELSLYLRDKVASFKRPQRFDVVPSLPRNASGKILRRELRRAFWEGRERAVN